VDRASFSKISVIGYLLACHRRGLCLISGTVHLGFVVDKAALRQVFLILLPFSHIGIISPLLPNSYVIPLTPPVLYDLRSWLCVIYLPNYMVPCPRSSYLHLYHREQLVQNCPFIKLNVLMEVPDLWLQTAKVHLSSPNCCLAVWLNLVFNPILFVVICIVSSKSVSCSRLYVQKNLLFLLKIWVLSMYSLYVGIAAQIIKHDVMMQWHCIKCQTRQHS